MYKTAMNGTIFSATAPMRRIPPSITTPHKMTIAAPVAQAGTPKPEDSALDTELAWLMFPIPNEASRQNMEKSTASQRRPSPRSRKTMGPPIHSPAALR